MISLAQLELFLRPLQRNQGADWQLILRGIMWYQLTNQLCPFTSACGARDNLKTPWWSQCTKLIGLLIPRGITWYQLTNQLGALTSPWWLEGQFERVPGEETYLFGIAFPHIQPHSCMCTGSRHHYRSHHSDTGCWHTRPCLQKIMQWPFIGEACANAICKYKQWSTCFYVKHHVMYM